ncbi:hypothetical protein BaRGS_00024000 [Batillaria attramentaria]|uniref:protein-tyrosine-phosphatase n=1 Tax=Batillaria attramentaria TaxID=370345 RepID=A0ABD0KCM0_9CAEN
MCSVTGWFGPDCVYQCQCRNNRLCDQIYGHCPRGVCESGFAGTACQYVDLAYNQPADTNLPYLTHGDAAYAVDASLKTCFVTGLAENSTWSVKLKEASWVNTVSVFVVNSSARADQLDVSLYNDDDDIHVVATPHVTKPNATRYYYHLPQPARVSRVQIRTTDNDTSLSLCDVNVYGGRNIALRKNATQGEKTRAGGVASRAVDGNTDGDFDHRSCTHTEDRDRGKDLRSWWTVVLGNPQHIWRVRVYNREDSNSDRLSVFRVNVTYDDGTTEQVYRESKLKPPRVTDIHLPKPTVGTELTVWHYAPGRILTLCEVEVYGDCLDGYFGWLCDTKCRCENPDEICDKLWGMCPVSGCRAGWRGDDCQLECLNGTYGYKCGFNCSGTCRDHVCHHVTGECTNGCAPGWEGDRCIEMCQPTVFGQNCSEVCPPNCLDTRCHHVTGLCNEGCEPGWMGDNCTEPCGRGFHGLNCSSNCSADCANNACDATSGDCAEGCVAGRTGTRCEQLIGTDQNGDKNDDGSEGMMVVGVVMGILVLLLVAVIIGVVVWIRRRPKSHTGKQSVWSQHDTSQAHLVDETDDATDRGNNSGQPVGFSGLSSIEERVNPAQTPSMTRRDRAREQYEMHQPQTKTESQQASTNAEASQGPERQPSTKRPELMALFSRDATSDVPLLDTATPSSRASTANSSPKSKRSTPTPAKRMASLASLDTLSMDEVEVVPLQMPTSPSKKDNSDYYNVVCRDFSPNTVISVSELPAKVAAWLAQPRHFNKERSMLPAGNVSKCEIAMLPQNIRKNRYRDIYPYDEFRVKLDPLPDDPFSDYYNASFIDGYEREKEYVAAQGPMERTTYDFLRMVWDLTCHVIVMLTNTVELGRFKCQQYWPDEGSMTQGDITVTLHSCTTFADYCIRELTLHRGDYMMDVTMFHYTAWPDNFAAASPWSLIDFRRKVRKHMGGEESQTIVHCSAGIGRTGTYLALDILLARAEHEDKIDVFTCVWKLRQQRICMVQTLAQYIFIHEALAAALTTPVPVHWMDFDLDLLLNEKDGKRLVDEEFKNLQNLTPTPERETHADSGHGGRYNPAELLGVPRDIDRVHVLSPDGRFSPVYINAIFLSSYTQARAFIQTHTPLHGAVVDFLSMVLQHNVTTIVCLDTTIGTDEGRQAGTVQYWPKTAGKFVTFGPYQVKLLETSVKFIGLVFKFNLRITFCPPQDTTVDGPDTGSDKEFSRDLTLYKCNLWQRPVGLMELSYLTPTGPSILLELVSVVAPSEQAPAVVHCRDGYTRSGLFCVAATVLERLRKEGHVAVSYVTAHMRVPRRENIVSVEQYEFLYEFVQEAINETYRLKHGRDKTPAQVDIDENPYGNVDLRKRDDEGIYGNVNSKIDVNVDASKAEDNADSKKKSDEDPYGNVSTAKAEDNVDSKKKGDGDPYGNVSISKADDNVDSKKKSDEDPYGNVSTAKAEDNVDSKKKGDEDPYGNVSTAKAEDNVDSKKTKDEGRNVDTSEAEDKHSDALQTDDEHPYGNVGTVGVNHASDDKTGKAAKTDGEEQQDGGDSEDVAGDNEAEENIYSNI